MRRAASGGRPVRFRARRVARRGDRAGRSRDRREIARFVSARGLVVATLDAVITAQHASHICSRKNFDSPLDSILKCKVYLCVEAKMEIETMRIGEVARQAGVNVQTLRY